MRTDIVSKAGLALFVVASTVFVAPGWGCASEQKLPPVALDPSNPAAPESAPLVVADLGQPVEPVKASKPDTAKESGKPETGKESGKPETGKPETSKPAAGKQLYTCPMHPEVIRDKPGRCPICGMTLVPKEPAEGKK